MTADLYALLEVAPDADEAEIRRAYQKLARRYHPDILPGDHAGERRFAEVARAFEVLTDPDLRRRYDRLREEGEDDERVARWSGSEEVLAFLEGGVVRSTRRLEIRREVRRGRVRGGRRPAAAEPATVEVVLDFAEAVRGATRSFPLQREEGCPHCGGGGRVGGQTCPRCGGRGTLVELERVRVRFPRGIEDGDQLRVPGKGGPLGPGRQADLLLRVRVEPHPYFRRRGRDVHADLPITMAEAVLGTEVEVPTLDGPVRVKIPAGTSGGRTLRLKRRGIPGPGGEAGDHYCRIVVQVPERVDGELRELLKRFSQEDPRRDLPKEPV